MVSCVPPVIQSLAIDSDKPTWRDRRHCLDLQALLYKLTSIMPISFSVTLTARDWDPNLGGWRCPALRIPGSVIDALFDKGSRVDSSWYEPLPEHGMVRWVRDDDHPHEPTILLKLTQELSTRELTTRWKKLAIVLPVIATVLAAVVSGSVTYFAAKPRSAEVTPKKGDQGTVGPTTSPISVNTEFSIMMPRGLRTIVTWQGMPEDGKDCENILRKAGIDVSKVDEGLREAYAALARRPEESIVFGPGVIENNGQITFLPGYVHEIERAGPSEDSQYSEFQMFQQKDSFVIYVDLKKPDGAIDPSKIGINWNLVREGLSTAQNALYKGQKQVTFENVGIYNEPNGAWHYVLPYSIRTGN
jgi:hypothetical protein